MKKFLLAIAVCFLSVSVFGHDRPSGPAGAIDYFKVVTPQERQSVTYIVNTLADKGGVSLMFAEGSLNKAGDKLEQLHPLKFFEIVFTSPKLTSQMRRVRGKSFVWKNFIKDMGASLSRQANAGNMKPSYVEAFAKETGVKEDLIQPAIEKQQWTQFIDIMLKNK